MSLTPNEKDLLAKKSDLEGILKPDANDILHLPDITISLAENQQRYTTSGLSKDGLVFAGAGTITGITSSDGNSTSLAASQSMVSAKQDKLIAGSNITIAQDGKTISATDTNEIENLQDVDITNLANGQILKYNSTSQKWENGNESGGGSSTLAGLSDVDITSPSAGQGLVYDAINQEWVNSNVSASSSIDTLTDVNLTNLSNGQILKYNSTSQEWENANESGGGGSSALSELTDVTVTSPSDGQVLTYDNTSGKWVNDTPTASSSISTLTDVNLTSLSDGQILKYDATNQEWVNADGSGGGGGSIGRVDTLWTGDICPYTDGTTDITLNHPHTDYDYILVNTYDTNYNMYGTSIFYDLKTNYNYEDTIDSQSDVRNILLFQVLGDTSIKLKNYGGLGQCTHYVGFYGVKLGGGSGGAGAEEITLSDYNALTTEQKNDGTIRFIPESNIGTSNAVDTSNVTNAYIEGAMSLTSSSDEIAVVWNGNSNCGLDSYITAKIDVTDYDYIIYDLTTGNTYDYLNPGSANPIRNLGIGLCSTTPSTSGWTNHTQITWAASKVYNGLTDANETFANETIDVSDLTGEYYFVMCCAGWNFTIEDLTLATAGGNVSQIKYMDKTYGANRNTLSGLSDVDLTNLSDKQILKYDASTQKWINEDESGGGGGEGLPSSLVKLAEYTGSNPGYAASTVITLSQSMSNFDMLIFTSNYSSKATGFANASVMVEDFKNRFTTTFYVTYNPAAYTDVLYVDNTHISVSRTGSAYPFSVYGLKFGTVSSAYKETTLYSATASTPAPATITLSESYQNYDLLIFNLRRSADGGTMYKYDRVLLTSQLAVNNSFQLVTYNELASYLVASTTSFTLINSSSMYIENIIGIKYGGGKEPLHNYSTTEQAIGTWINGETVYQKSFQIQITTASVSSPLIIESDASYIDALIEYSAVAKNASGYIAGTGMSASGWGFAIHRNPSNQLILYGDASEIVGGTAYVTIKYTKVSS